MPLDPMGPLGDYAMATTDAQPGSSGVSSTKPPMTCISSQTTPRPAAQPQVHTNPFSDPLDSIPEEQQTLHPAYPFMDSDAEFQCIHPAHRPIDPSTAPQPIASPAPAPSNLPKQHFAKDTWSNSIPGVWAINNVIRGHYITKCSATYEIIFPPNVYHYVRVTQKPWRDVKDLPEILFLSSTDPRHFAFEPLLILRSLHSDSATPGAAFSDKKREQPPLSKLLPAASEDIKFSNKSLETIMTNVLHSTMENINRTTQRIRKGRMIEFKFPHHRPKRYNIYPLPGAKAKDLAESRRGVARAYFAVRRARELCVWLSKQRCDDVTVERLQEELEAWQGVAARLVERVEDWGQ